ncbi:MAG: hypothetical protein JO233_07380 [Candidatus Eremiobacteraeota bacterium]|nr:hypothetical protein [Candidatus Eremiobacteraeota bacterium]
MTRMFDFAPQLASALRQGADQLQRSAATAALAETNLGASTSNRTMASLAQAAIFTETLLNAIRARLQEIRLVSK